ncbi:MAG TPA: branched-chain amino acid ABC transporter permease [Ramlibacter sp.]|nr:branched-chain amino acid ABC transporter permease [Ramlibacter sp.]
MFTSLLQALLSGLVVGSAYALVALGFSVTFTTTRTLNFAHGDFVSLGAFIGLSVLFTSLGMSVGSFSLGAAQPSAGGQLAAVLAAVVGMGLIGCIMFFAGVRPFAGRPGMAWVMSTLGFGLLLQALIIAVWGPKSVGVPGPFGSDVIRVFGVGVLPQELLTLGVATVIMLVFDRVMRRSTLGKAMRAVALKPDVASLMGINVTAMMVGAYVVSSALAGLSGFLLAPIIQVSLIMGAAIGLKGFAAGIVGGLDNARGCVFGGFLMGVLESLINLWSAQWREIAILLLVIVVLALKPNGLFGARVMDKV